MIKNRPELTKFQGIQDFLIGIDSDGCAFDTMEVKHKDCFIPGIIEFYRLASVARLARERLSPLTINVTNSFATLIASSRFSYSKPTVNATVRLFGRSTPSASTGTGLI